MHNRFFDPEGGGGEMPGRVYALFDQRESERLLFEAVDADWFEDSTAMDVDFEGWAVRAPDAPLSVLEVREEIFRQWSPVPIPDHREGHEDEGPLEWVEIGLNPAGEEARIYLGLFAAAAPIGVEYMRRVPAEVAQSLDRAFDLAPFVATPDALQSALGSLNQTIEWIGVYDIGQGSANGLCEAHGVPLAYFDLGGGVLANKATFPSAFSGICVTFRPLVILSHWDWDHWSSGARFPAASALRWIVPHQKLGAVHGTMAASIVSNGQLLVWPSGLPGLNAGQVTIEKCTGTSGRNNSGLAMFVDGPPGEKPILLTGDARYSAIPSGFADYLSVVVPHHGADMKSKATPVGTGHAAARVAYSYGPASSFSHPRTCTYRDHHVNSWPHRHVQSGGTIDLHTPDLRPALGHIALGWSATAPTPIQPCRGRSCSLQLVQR